MPDPTFDKDGYPTEETLEAIRKWDHGPKGDWRGLLQFVRDAWYYPDRVMVEETTDELDRPCVEWYFSTGGWSGNEDLIGALMDNTVFWMMHWYRSQRGGHFTFHDRAAEAGR